MRTIAGEDARFHPHWVIRSIQSGYNCMGLVFAARRTAIDADYFSLIAQDDDLRPVPWETARAGDVGVYWSGSSVIHVAMCLGRETVLGADKALWLLSKFGRGPEYEHLHVDVPKALRYDRFEVWTERRL